MVRDFEIKRHCRRSDKLDPYYFITSLLLTSRSEDLHTLEETMGLRGNKSYAPLQACLYPTHGSRCGLHSSAAPRLKPHHFCRRNLKAVEALGEREL
jgi:hypothetical protein